MHHSGPQTVLARSGAGNGSYRSLFLPSADQELLPGVRWGAFDRVLTPAFWAARAWLLAPSRAVEEFRLGRTLREEMAACLLGGYGFRAEIGLAVFERVRERRLLEGAPTPDELEALLARPLEVDGRSIRYRFARQKAAYLAEALPRIDGIARQHRDDREFRDALLALRGIGLKTASWITRNWRGSDSVAILDVHVCRACRIAGVFPAGGDPSRGYLELERLFLAFAAAIGVRASVLDNLMWQTVRRLPTRLRGLRDEVAF